MIGGSFAQVIHSARLQAGLTIQELAPQVGVSASYLRQFEQGGRTPAVEQVIVALADVLSVEVNTLMALIGRFGDRESCYLKTHPTLRRIVCLLVDRALTESELERVVAIVVELPRRQATQGRWG